MKAARKIWLSAALFVSGALMLLAAHSHAPTADEQHSKLTAARKTLHISEASMQAIEEELNRLRQTGTASIEKLERIQAYLDRVSETVGRQRNVLHKMEALYVPGEPLLRHESPDHELDPALIPSLPTSTSRTDELDREFKASLEEFDGVLMKEMDELARDREEIEESASEESSELASAIAAAKRRLEEQRSGQKGEEAQTPGAGEETDEGAPGENTNAEAKSGKLEKGDEERTSEGVGMRQGDASKFPEGNGDGSESTESSTGDETSTARHGEQTDRPHGQTGNVGAADEESDSVPREMHGDEYDDDIVSRQLREAAEKETDPVLKAKLWDEYHAYKKSKAR